MQINNHRLFCCSINTLERPAVDNFRIPTGCRIFPLADLSHQNAVDCGPKCIGHCAVSPGVPVHVMSWQIQTLASKFIQFLHPPGWIQAVELIVPAEVHNTTIWNFPIETLFAQSIHVYCPVPVLILNLEALRED
ncbi:MAG: hypothetical protein WBO37_00235, partial [Gammaproteobacteria bacterium]